MLSDVRKILICVEDPGAVNFVTDLPEQLDSSSFKLDFCAQGFACEKLESASIPYCTAEEATARLEQYDLVLLGTAENRATFTFSMTEICQKKNIATAGFVDGPAAAAHRFKGHSTNPLQYLPDLLILTSRETADRFNELGVPSNRIALCEHPVISRLSTLRQQLESQGKDRIRRRVFPDATEEQTVILFIAELSDGLESERYSLNEHFLLKGRGGTTDRTLIALEELLDARTAAVPESFVVVRLHPKNILEEFSPYQAETDQFSKGGSPYEAVFAADLCVGLTSILLHEAMLLGTRTFAILPDPADRTLLDEAGLCQISSASSKEAIKTELLGAHPHIKHPNGPQLSDVIKQIIQC
ncbi:hypothetical protein [Kiloniella litopenaei]|uniref:hypothetical protein n=1 Tax=Kiloniella litopenaei TaxID=1549748 RepID=UPI003BA88FB1